MLGQSQLMNSRLSVSEEALATIACKRIEVTERPVLLIGGMGMGFTLRAALAVRWQDAHIVVAELMPAVVKWAWGAMAGTFGDSLTDPRIIVREDDAIDLIESSPSTFDVILLDVDNGPTGLTRDANN
jgi:spermidine synthase